MPNDLKIDKDFEGLLPQLTPMQLAQLEANLERDGWRKEQAIVTWANHDDTIVDGMNRYKICKRLGIDFKTVAKSFEDRDAVKEWIRTNAAGTRNMTPEQEAANRGAIYNLRKKRHGAEEGGRGNQHDPVKDQSEPLPTTAEVLAEQFGVSPATIKRDGKLADALDRVTPALKAEFLAGNSPLSKGDLLDVAAIPIDEQPEAVEEIVAAKTASRSKPISQTFFESLEGISTRMSGIRDQYGSVTEMLASPLWRGQDTCHITALLEDLYPMIGDMLKEFKDHERKHKKKRA